MEVLAGAKLTTTSCQGGTWRYREMSKSIPPPQVSLYCMYSLTSLTCTTAYRVGFPASRLGNEANIWWLLVCRDWL